MRNPALRFYLALAFLVWSLVPHFRLVMHAHAGEKAGHSHATFTAEELRLADEALQALPAAAPKDFGGECTGSPIAASGESTWMQAAGPLAHAHLQHDLNSVPCLLLDSGIAARAPPGAAPDLRYRAPATSAPADKPARGPPASFLA